MKCGGLGALALSAALMLGCGSASSDADEAADPLVGTGETDGSETESEAGDAADDESDGPADSEADDDDESADTESDAETDEADDTTTTTDPGPAEVTGTVVSSDGDAPIEGAVVIVGDETVSTDADGGFTIQPSDGQDILVRRPTFLPVTIEASDQDQDQNQDENDLTVTMEPVVSRGVRVSREVAADGQRYRELLDQIETTTVNSLVFDTKDETGQVLYETEVATAEQLGAVEALYDPEELLAQAAERGLYPITRVVTFEDKIWAGADPEAKLAGAWVDATNQANWEYPLALAEEACAIGFAEIQFDYVRYPAGRTAEVAAGQVPATADERSAVIASFLAEARTRLEPRGCGVSAAIFGIVMSSETDEGIGQTVEAVSAEVDAVSPMLYPSHYGPGWLGFADPNDHPGPVIADALDDGLPRLSEPIQMRPWIQAFYYNGAQIGAQIDEAEARGAGWLLWNASGRYRDDWLPASS